MYTDFLQYQVIFENQEFCICSNHTLGSKLKRVKQPADGIFSSFKRGWRQWRKKKNIKRMFYFNFCNAEFTRHILDGSQFALSFHFCHFIFVQYSAATHHLRYDAVLVFVKSFHEEVWRLQDFDETLLRKVSIIPCQPDHPDMDDHYTCWSPWYGCWLLLNLIAGLGGKS